MGEERNVERLLRKLAESKKPATEPKSIDAHKFWKTQPVPKYDESITEEGPIEPHKRPEDVRQEPYPLVEGFQWTEIDVTDDIQLEDVFVLLNENYVEDRDASFRFHYTREFFRWALMCPGWRAEWHIGVRAKESGKLVAFIAAVPSTLRVRSARLQSVEINFLCIHKQLRSKRLAPLLIKEITRRVNLRDCWHALYTAGTLLPAPISVCRYTHRPLNWTKLNAVGFTDVPMGATPSQMVARYTLPKSTRTPGLRTMKCEDLDQVYELYEQYYSRFALAQYFTREELEHWLLGDRSLPSDKQVIFSYVVEGHDGTITDFFSFYSLPFTILDNPKHRDLNIAYLYHYGTTAGSPRDSTNPPQDRFEPTATKELQNRLKMLMGDACILARDLGMDVLNALTSQDNVLFLDELKFGPGDGFLNFYLFNYRAFPIAGGLKEDSTYDLKKRSDVGVVML